MKIISEKTGKEYSSVDECLAAEKEFEDAIAAKKAAEEKRIEDEKARVAKLNEERKARAAEVEEAYKAVLEANKAYRELLDKFVKDYGSFHMTLKTGDLNPFDNFSHLFNFWF